MSSSSTYTMWASFVARGEDAQRVELGQRDAVARASRRVRGEVHHAPADAVALGQGPRPLHERGRARAEAQQQRPRADPSARPAVHRLEHRLVQPEGVAGRLLHGPRSRGEVPGPPSEHRPHADGLDRVRDRRHVEERARLAERRRPGPDHLDAGEEGGHLLLLRGDHGVERDQPVREVPVDGDVVEEEAPVQVLREVHVGVHEAGEHDAAPAIDDAGGRARRAHGPGRPDLDDVPAVHQDRAVGQDPAVPVQRDDGGVLDQDHGRTVLRAARTPRARRPAGAGRRARPR